MWDETNQTTDVNCKSLQLAVKVGILGIILQVLWSFMYTSIMMQLSEWSSSISSISITLSLLSVFGIIPSVFASVGFVAIFAMKGSKLGIIFPLMVILSRLWNSLYIRISFSIGIYSAGFHQQSNLVIGYAIAIIAVLALFTIRDRSANKDFLIVFVIIYLIHDILSDAIWLIIFGGPVHINTVLDALITQLPDLLIGIAFAILAIIFFIIESRQGCTGRGSMQEFAYSE